MQPGIALQRFIESIGQRQEAAFWLRVFRAEAKHSFATVVVEADVLLHALDAVVVDLRFLAAVGLTPVVALGLHDEREVEARALTFRQHLEEAGIRASVIGYASAREHVEPIVTATREGRVPVVPFGKAAGREPDERVACLGRLLTQLTTNKLIFLRTEGPWRRDGVRVQAVNLTTEYADFLEAAVRDPQQHALLVQAHRLMLELVPHSFTIAITSPFDLLRELFTVKGAGTLLRRGTVIEVRAGFEALDTGRLRELLRGSFGRPPADDFFARPVSRVYLEPDYRGAAIVVDTSLGAYLSKFVVDRQAQGEGMGRDLWDALVEANPVLFWRARPTNPISSWYMKVGDGFVRSGPWLTFWKGLAPEKITEVLAYTLAQPNDMGGGGGGD